MKRRWFLGAAAAATFEHLPLETRLRGETAPEHAPGGVPVAALGSLKVTRLICGGNLFSGFAHSGSLLYVSSLLRQYFQEEKILDTLQLCEESGINTAMLRTDDHIIKVLKRYRKERGGKIQWIAQTYPTAEDLEQNVRMAIDNGAAGAYVMGGNSERFFKAGKIELIGEVLATMRRNGLVAGVGAHTLEIVRAVQEKRLEPDFYFKTLNNVGYESEKPETIAAYMKTIRKPWVAFKVLGAGRMQAPEGFDLAFQSGADFINVGMYDFQVKQDVALASDAVRVHGGRERPWSA